MIEINFKNNKNKAIIDDIDAHLLRWKWFISSHGYAVTDIYLGDRKSKRVYLHHCIQGKSINGLETDHINLNRLDNRRHNLRFVSHRENNWNTHRQKNGFKTSKYVGVSIDRLSGKWRAAAWINGKTRFLGHYKDEIDAANAYLEAISNVF